MKKYGSRQWLGDEDWCVNFVHNCHNDNYAYMRIRYYETETSLHSPGDTAFEHYITKIATVRDVIARHIIDTDIALGKDPADVVGVTNRIWLNPDDVIHTGSVCTYIGKLDPLDGDAGIISMVEISDCHKSVRMVMQYKSEIERWKEALRRVVSEIDLYLNWYEGVKDEKEDD